MKTSFPILCSVFFYALLTSSSFAVSVEQMNSIPLAFTLNEGQAHSSIKFTARGSGCGMAFSPSGTTFFLPHETADSAAKRAAKNSVLFQDNPVTAQPEYETNALNLSFVGANENPEISGEDRLPWNNNYFIGNDSSKWRTDVPNYKKIKLTEVYKGIDLVYYGNQKRIKYDFIVKPGENPEQILLRYDFGDSGGSLSVNADGELVVKTPFGELIEKKPYCYQKISGKEIPVGIAYEAVSDETYRFRIGEYNAKYDLIVDPEVVYSTYLGGSEDDRVDDIAVDSEGYVYVTGFTGATGADSTNFPVTPGAYDTSFHTIFVSKINPEGTAFIYSTYLGGSEASYDSRIAVDSQGNACLTGEGVAGFPITENAIDKQTAGIFITKLNFLGNKLITSTFWGSQNHDYSRSKSIALDTEDNIYITGYTYSDDFPTTQGTYKEKNDHSGGQVVFITKLNPDASDVLFSTFVGVGAASNITVNSYGEVFIIGNTYSISPDYPLTDNAFDTTPSTIYPGKVFVTKLNNTLSGLIYSTLLGGSASNASFGLALDSSGCAYVCGSTTSTDFPTTPDAFMTSSLGTRTCGFVSKISYDGGKLEYSTLLTGKENNTEYTDTYIRDIAIYDDKYAIITGYTNAIFFPTTDDAIKSEDSTTFNDAILTILSKDGRSLLYSTCWGGSRHDEAETLALDGNGDVYIAGQTTSKDFPISSHAVDDTLTTPLFPTYTNEGFVSKFHFDSIISGVSENKATPSEFKIISAYPNPFNPSTTIEFSIPEPGKVKMMVYAVTGQKVYEKQMVKLFAGTHRIQWNGKDMNNQSVSSGTYLIQLKNGIQSISQKILLMK